MARPNSKPTHLQPVGARVNLMPQVEVQRRRRSTLISRWLVAGVGSVAVVALVTLAAQGWRLTSEAGLAAEQNRSVQLSQDLVEYSELTEVMAERTELEAMRAEALSNDLQWSGLISDVEAAMPAGVELIGTTLTVGGVPGEAADSSLGLGGVLTFRSAEPKDQADTVVALRTVKGVLLVDAGALTTNDEGQIEFSVTFSVNQTRYTGRFAAEKEK